MLSDFTLGDAIGQGATATVYRATHTRSGTRVALKAMDATQGPNLRVVQAEIRAMARVEHANLLGVLDHGLVTRSGGPLPVGTAWMALDYASGGSLEGWRPPDWASAREVLVDLLAGLAHAHARGLLHRDLKPANLLRCTAEDTRPGIKIADFGLAWVMGSEHGLRCGTPLYMAPEQNERNGALGPWTDLYAVGNLIFEWTTGSPPFARKTVKETLAAQREATLPALDPLYKVPSGLAMLIAHLLQKEPERRPTSAAWLAWALQQLPEPSFTPVVPVSQAVEESVPPARNLTHGLGLGLLPMRDFPVIGRDAERERIWERLGRLQQARSQIVLLSGPRGVGRDRLCRWVVRRVLESGVAEAATVSGGRVKNLASGAVGERIGRWVRGQTTPTVLLLPTAMDITAIDLMTTLALERPDVPILLLGPDADPAFDWSRFASEDGFLHLHLGPVPDIAIQSFAHDGLGLTFPLAAEVSLQADGFMGRALELGRTWVERDQLQSTPQGLALRDGVDPTWPHVHAHLYRRLLESDPAGATVLERYAELHATGAADPWQVLEALGDAPPTDLLTQLSHEHLVHLEPFHVLDPGLLVVLRQSFARRADANATRLAMAEVLSLPARGLMLYRAGRTAEATTLLTPWIEAHCHHAAIQRVPRRMVASGFANGDTSARFLVQVAQLAARVHTDGVLPAIPDLDALLAHVPPGDAVQRRLMHRLATRYLWHAERYDQALEHLGPAAFPPLEEATLAGLIHVDSGHGADGVPLLMQVVREGAPDQVVRAANGLGRLAMHAEQPERAIEWFEEMFAASDIPRARTLALVNLCLPRLDLGHWERAEQVARRALAQTERRPGWVGHLSLVLTLVGLATERPNLSKLHAERALTHLRTQDVEDAEFLLRICRRITPATRADAELMARITTLLKSRMT